jgi:hypothetical protein
VYRLEDFFFRPMRFLDLMVWICFHSYRGWSKSSMYNGYLQMTFLHITCALCLCIHTYYVKVSILSHGERAFSFVIFFIFCDKFLSLGDKLQRNKYFFCRCQGIIVKISLNYFLRKIYPIQQVFYANFYIYCRTWRSPIKRFSQIWLHHNIWKYFFLI